MLIYPDFFIPVFYFLWQYLQKKKTIFTVRLWYKNSLQLFDIKQNTNTIIWKEDTAVRRWICDSLHLEFQLSCCQQHGFVLCYVQMELSRHNTEKRTHPKIMATYNLCTLEGAMGLCVVGNIGKPFSLSR